MSNVTKTLIGKEAQIFLENILKSNVNSHILYKNAGSIRGFYFDESTQNWVGFDNTTSKMLVEEFKTSDEAYKWLLEDNLSEEDTYEQQVFYHPEQGITREEICRILNSVFEEYIEEPITEDHGILTDNFCQNIANHWPVGPDLVENPLFEDVDKIASNWVVILGEALGW